MNIVHTEKSGGYGTIGLEKPKLSASSNYESDQLFAKPAAAHDERKEVNLSIGVTVHLIFPRRKVFDGSFFLLVAFYVGVLGEFDWGICCCEATVKNSSHS